MNDLRLHLEVADSSTGVTYDGIQFLNAAFVKAAIDTVPLESDPRFEDAVLVFSEIVKSVQQPGDYLIITCACGIADDGGWGFVRVSHAKGVVEWIIPTTPECVFRFELGRYKEEVERVESLLTHLPKHITIEPKQVVYPER